MKPNKYPYSGSNVKNQEKPIVITVDPTDFANLDLQKNMDRVRSRLSRFI